MSDADELERLRAAVRLAELVGLTWRGDTP